MKKETILRKAIEKAVKNGWKTKHISNIENIDGFISWMLPYKLNYIIFSHSFAKAFFGEEWGKEYTKDRTLWHPDKAPWQYHLQQLVLCKNPLKYLEKFL